MAKPTPDPTERFFDAVAAYGYSPLLRKADGTTRFEIVDGKRTSRWFVTVTKGHMSVSRRGVGDPDCAIKADKAGKIPFQCGMAMYKGTIAAK